jgi:hypothetical protein
MGHGGTGGHPDHPRPRRDLSPAAPPVGFQNSVTCADQQVSCCPFVLVDQVSSTSRRLIVVVPPDADSEDCVGASGGSDSMLGLIGFLVAADVDGGGDCGGHLAAGVHLWDSKTQSQRLELRGCI